ncbi:HAMP domain-containing histidine kinase [Clostridium sp. MSJ-11]|uniref:histidine kinase n=1 Tax=Clostridium mobile TaxID=2841512 RepID=A0ABS6EDR7_9CLOT|nr:HAMP domain-containing sensor histidine kinase [Clostridium mobile]MBU5483351.1 HAMP domain-containing histidine kinase [Clostridium mobile]
MEKDLKRSIKKRLFRSFMIIIVITVMAIETVLMNFVKMYYYSNVEEVLSNQIKISSDFYSRYFSNSSLEENIMENVDVFWKQTNAQVQIINLKGNVLMDSIGTSPKELIDSPDVKKALKGELGKWIGMVEYDNAKVMAISYPLKSQGKIVGVLRYISTLRDVDKAIMSISTLFLLIGFIVIILVGIISIFLSNSIVDPLKKLTKTAEKMANGDLEIRNEKEMDDEIGKLSDTLNYMAEELLKKEKLKNDFISSVSHELRTPLTAIKGWAITLNTEEFPPEDLIRDGLTIIEKESDRLSLMVEELLDFSKLISGKVSIKKEKTNIGEIIEYIEKYIGPRSKREKIDFTINYEDELPVLFMDKNRIKQVLINLLDNAFKFMKDDVNNKKISLSIYKEKEYAIIKVEDNGCGIEKEELPKVKEKFYKGKSSKSQNGIGLSICDEIVKMHGGELIIESEINVGTSIYVKLPLFDH